MRRVNWDGEPLKGEPAEVPQDLHETIFEYLPPQIPMTPVIEELAERYLNGQITGRDYVAMQAAAFIRPKSQEVHRTRRSTFELRAAKAEAEGFVIPDVFRTLVQTDAYVDRLHHNCIWLQMPEELWRLPCDPSQLVFLAFTEGQGCCNWHLLLAPDGSHCVVCCEHPFGVPSNWAGEVPDYSQWTIEKCADSIEEWLYHYFKEAAEHDQGYVESLEPY
jgi:hypothetical protein